MMSGEQEHAMSMTTTARPARSTQREKKTPKYIARAKVQNGWVTIGAAWPFRSGEDGLSVQINVTPLGWDGRFTLLTPLGNEEVPETPEE
jgi:hypothetical protein